MLSSEDIKQIEKKGIDIKTVENQIKNFTEGFPYINLFNSATIGNGIIRLSKDETQKFIQFYHDKNNLSSIKFVPASGAASRMFKFLYEYLDSKKENKDIEKFKLHLTKFAFYNDLEKSLQKKNKEINSLISKGGYSEIIKALLLKEGLNYGNMPKALILFHLHNNQPITAAEEHLIEASHYLKVINNEVKVHFTVSQEHMGEFKKLFKSVIPNFEKEYHLKYNIEYSVQDEKTDTIAVDMENKPFKLKDGAILFRPGGHGALLENLNKINSDIIFIKNIDNVCADVYKEATFNWKKILAGYLLFIRENIYGFLNILDSAEENKINFNEITDFAKKYLQYKIDTSFNHLSIKEKINYLHNKLNRPIRVCGMVKNEGEPGGGPFWVKDKNGQISLQIIEKSQVNLSAKKQKEIFDQSTHFNPVDIACSTKNYKGQKFNLFDYLDPDTGFISEKSMDGKELKALELPGLWNGSMANWNTIFIETPIETFNPVKTVNDLLKKGHQK